MRVSLDPEQIRSLADRINSTVQGLQNIDQILAETENNRALAQRLNRSAEQASYVFLCRFFFSLFLLRLSGCLELMPWVS